MVSKWTKIESYTLGIFLEKGIGKKTFYINIHVDDEDADRVEKRIKSLLTRYPFNGSGSSHRTYNPKG